MTKDEALKLAFDALDSDNPDIQLRAAIIIRGALAQPEQDEKFCDANCVWTDHHPDCKLAQPEQEPASWVDLVNEAQRIVKSKFLWKKFIDGTPLANDIAVWMAEFAQQYATPPKRKPLSDAKIALISAECSLRTPSDIYFARAIEAAHGIKE